MQDDDADHSGFLLPPELTAELTRLHDVLQQRGWRRDPDTTLCWRWPASPPEGLDLFRAGPLILFDEEDPGQGYFVESPLLHDDSVPILRYTSIDALIDTLDKIEGWTYPQTASDIDPDHVFRPGRKCNSDTPPPGVELGQQSSDEVA